MAKRNYSGFEEWINKLDCESPTIISIDELAKDCNLDEGFPKNCNWSNNRTNTFANYWLGENYIVKHDKANKKVQFIYDPETAKAISNGEGTIILNNMYTGRYISSQGNLGHEAINLIRADKKPGEEKGKFYIWLNSMGVCTELKKDDKCTVLMVRSINENLYKVLAYAEECRLCDGANISRKKKNSGTDDKIKRCNAQRSLKVTYNKKCPIDDIYKEQDMFATFCTNTVYEAVDDIYITNDPEKFQNSPNVLYADFKISEAMRAYIRKDHEASIPLSNLISNKNLWKEIADNDFSNIKEPQFNFFKLIQKDRDELAFSNALAYFIGEIGIQEFLEKGLKISDTTFLNDKYQLYREKNNIDVSFFGEENVVIIENKIDAAITADAKTTINSQINRAVELYFNDQCGISKDTYKNKMLDSIKAFSGDASQLSKYYIYAFAYLLSKGLNENDIKNRIKCFLLIPQYSTKDFKCDPTGCYKSRFLLSEKYRIITYKDILDNFFKNATINDPKIDNYLADFKSALESLANEVNNEFEEEMKYRFGKTIGEIT